MRAESKGKKGGLILGLVILSFSETCLRGYWLKANSGLKTWTELKNLNQSNDCLTFFCG